PVSVGRVAGGVLATEVLIRVRPVKDIVRHGRDELRYRDRVLLKVSEHLVRGAGNGVALAATVLSEEEERATLLGVVERAGCAARVAIDRRVREGERELELGDRAREHLEVDQRPIADGRV